MTDEQSPISVQPLSIEEVQKPPDVEIWVLKFADGSPDIPVRSCTVEQLQKMQYEQYQNYQALRNQAMEILGRAENALSGANLLAYELDRRKRAAQANGAGAIS